MKRIITLLLSLCILLSCAVTAFAARDFSDVKAGQWYYEAVYFCADRGLVGGYPDGTFHPDGNITRGEMAVIMNKMLNLSIPAVNTFSDVENGKWYTGPILNCVRAGIIAGYNSKQFGVNDNMTREQAAVILANAFGIKAEEKQTDFADNNSISDWAKGSVRAMAKEKLIAGMGNNTFAPKANITRSAVCQIIYARQTAGNEDDFILVSERYKDAAKLYDAVLLYQDDLDKNDTVVETSNGRDWIYYRVPQANTKEEFLQYCRKYYTSDVADSLVNYHKYIEKDGKLYMNQTLGLGGPVPTKAGLRIRKDSDEQYSVEIHIYEDGSTINPDVKTARLKKIDQNWVWDTLIYGYEAEIYQF